jgi:hypothetical protein
MDRELVAGAESARETRVQAPRSRFEPCLVARDGVRRVPGPSAAERGNSYENYCDRNVLRFSPAAWLSRIRSGRYSLT